MADLANIAAANTAGYKEVAAQRINGVWQVTLEKQLPDVQGHDVVTVKAHGESSVSQAAAETVALAALNVQRQDRLQKLGGSIDTK